MGDLVYVCLSDLRSISVIYVGQGETSRWLGVDLTLGTISEPSVGGIHLSFPSGFSEVYRVKSLSANYSVS